MSSLDRRKFLLSIASLAATSSLPACANQVGLEKKYKPTAKKSSANKNIVLLIADDLGYGYDLPLVGTPNLNYLASKSAKFVNAYAAAPSCSPARASIYTGVYPHKHQLLGLSTEPNWFRLNDKYSQLNLMNILHERGYYTGRLGKLHIEPEERLQFDYNKKGDMRDPEAVRKNFTGFLEQSRQPFFLTVGFFDPHVAENNYVNQYHGYPPNPLTPDQVDPLPFQLVDDLEQRKRIAGYFNSIRRLDLQLGEVLNVLREKKLFENTLILFTSDQGPAFTRSKTTVYEASLKVPFILHWPGVFENGEVIDGLVSHLDIFPTIMDFAGIKYDYSVSGVNLMQAVKDNRFIFAEANYHFPCRYNPIRSIRDNRYKLIENLAVDVVKYKGHPPNRSIDGDNSYSMAMRQKYKGSVTQKVYELLANPPRFELYDLYSDPYELQNIAGKDKFTAIEKRLREELHKWQREDSDPYLDPEYVRQDWKKYCKKKLAVD